MDLVVARAAAALGSRLMATDTSQGKPSSEVKLVSEVIEVEGSLEAANDWFCDRKLSDGLPIVPPHA